MSKLNVDQAVIITGFTGVLCCGFSDFHADLEKRAGRPVWTHEMGDHSWIKPLYMDDFMALIPDEVE